MKLLPVRLQQYHWFIFVNLHTSTFNCHFTYLPNLERCFQSRLRNTLWYFSSLSMSQSSLMYLMYMSRSMLPSLSTRCSPVMSSHSTISICKKQLLVSDGFSVGSPSWQQWPCREGEHRAKAMQENVCNTVLAKEPLLYHPVISVMVVASRILKRKSLIGGKAGQKGTDTQLVLAKVDEPLIFKLGGHCVSDVLFELFQRHLCTICW
jgi:hypothetical protein